MKVEFIGIAHTSDYSETNAASGPAERAFGGGLGDGGEDVDEVAEVAVVMAEQGVRTDRRLCAVTPPASGAFTG